MIFIKRIIALAASIVGGLAGIILLAIINALANSGLTGGQVVLYGLIGGVVTGVSVSYYFTYLLIRKAKKILLNRFANLLGKYGFLKRMI